MHVIQHLLGTFRPDLIIAGVPEEANTDHNVSLQREAVLCSLLFDDRPKSHPHHTKSYVEFDLSMYGVYEGTVVAARTGEEDLIEVMNQILTFVNENAVYAIMYNQALNEAGMIDVDRQDCTERS